MQLANDGGVPSEKALRLCKEWLIKCLELGWGAKHMVELEAMWWEHHNSDGELSDRA